MADAGLPSARSADVVLDVRGLEPPEPLERVMDALASLPQKDILLMIIDREPRPLYGILQRNGFLFDCALRADMGFNIFIWRT
jgi:uncharacterized protein (DUF2249 family)